MFRAVLQLSPGLTKLVMGANRMPCTCASLNLSALGQGLPSLRDLELTVKLWEKELNPMLSGLSQMTGLTRLSFTAKPQFSAVDKPATLSVASLAALHQLRELKLDMPHSKLQGFFPDVPRACTQLTSLELRARGFSDLDPDSAARVLAAERQLLQMHETAERELAGQEAGGLGAGQGQGQKKQGTATARAHSQAASGSQQQKDNGQGQATDREGVRAQAAARVKQEVAAEDAACGRAPVWPSLVSAKVTGMEPGEVLLMQLHRAPHLRSISAPTSLFFERGSPFSTTPVFQDLCSALEHSCCLEPAGDTTLEIWTLW